MQKKGKLELTWVGKYDEEKPVEPRILLEDTEKSYGDPDSENMSGRSSAFTSIRRTTREAHLNIMTMM